MVHGNELRLDDYLRRVGYDGPRTPTPAVLAALHVAHVGRIPFENIDVQAGRPIRLDLASLQAKLVDGRRGGYCFEQNTLFAAVLRALGLSVTTLEARVRPPGASAILPRTHMVLAVEVAGERYLADVGFGGDGLLAPIPFRAGVSHQDGRDLRLRREGRSHVLQARSDGAWSDLYAIAPGAVFPVDYEVANHFTSTYATSPFRCTLTAQLSLPGERRILRNRTYLVRRGRVETTRELADEEIPALLRDAFGLPIPDGTVFPALADPPR
ncbi:MAG: arylamine N-acetyltransferase family protein [Acidobacteriota bacterium]